MARPERLQKYIARYGIASRRAAEELILDGHVRVNKKVVMELGSKVDADNDKVYIDGKLIMPEAKHYYIMLNKPKGYVATAKDERNRNIVTELITEIDARLYPVGRLDYLSEGLLFLTNDGDFAYRLSHPSQHVTKKYQVVVSGIPEITDIKKLREGIDIGGYITAPARVELAKIEERTAQLNITISEG
ncbi:MAG: rRNA pseudouridine synthase, partial [Clostridia bacterium]|nr:rRNA pseudouridine synthase [Clostridia bacterium]